MKDLVRVSSRMRCFGTLAGLTFVGLALIGGSTSASAASASYRCLDGTTFRAVFRGLGQGGSVQLNFTGRGRPMMLPQALSADGGRYVGGNAEFWIKGKSAQLMRQGVATECRTGS